LVYGRNGIPDVHMFNGCMETVPALALDLKWIEGRYLTSVHDCYGAPV
jgi:hypothetical protein